MLKSILLISFIFLFSISGSTASTIKLSPDEEKAVFLAAKYQYINKEWRACFHEEDKHYVAGSIEEVRDINGDGFPDAVVMDSSTFCYGRSGVSFTLVSKQANGEWKYMTSGTGYADFLDIKGANGWPDIEVGGPGFCFPVSRFDGEKYKFNRTEYDGKPCGNYN